MSDPISPEYKAMMNGLAGVIDDMFNGKDTAKKDRTVGFCLLVFPIGEQAEGRCNYISNGIDRRDMVALFREMAARLEGQPFQKGNA